MFPRGNFLTASNMSKVMLRLELQQKIIQVKYSDYQAVPSSSVPLAPHLHKALQASANNYFGFMSPPSVPSPSESCFINNHVSFFFLFFFEFLRINRNVIEDFCIY